MKGKRKGEEKGRREKKVKKKYITGEEFVQVTVVGIVTRNVGTHFILSIVLVWLSEAGLRENVNMS